MAATLRSALAARLDAATSRLFRLDLSRNDVVKWVDFARQLLAVLLFSVVTIAALSAFVSTRLARGLLVDSLDGEARAIAAAAAQAAFVPLALEDDKALAALAESRTPDIALPKLSAFSFKRLPPRCNAAVASSPGIRRHRR